jgi:hypothetical protein
LLEALHHREERDVRLGYRFEKPAFLKKIFVFRVPNEWQMGVQNKRERAHAPYRILESGDRKAKSTVNLRAGPAKEVKLTHERDRLSE